MLAYIPYMDPMGNGSPILNWAFYFGEEKSRDPQISTKIDRGPEKTGAPVRKLLAPQMNRFTMIQYSTGIFTIVQVAKD